MTFQRFNRIELMILLERVHLLLDYSNDSKYSFTRTSPNSIFIPTVAGFDLFLESLFSAKMRIKRGLEMSAISPSMLETD